MRLWPLKRCVCIVITGISKQAAASGQTHVVLIGGPPGIGKTCLLDALAAHARQQGVPVLRGGASEAEGMPPYLPFLEALGQHIHTATPNIVREQAGTLASVLATILPEFPLLLGELPVSYPLPAEQARLRLYEAVGMFLAAIAVPRALLLLLDDLQWADTATLDLLSYVVRHQPNARLLVLGSRRRGSAASVVRAGARRTYAPAAAHHHHDWSVGCH